MTVEQMYLFKDGEEALIKNQLFICGLILDFQLFTDTYAQTRKTLGVMG